MVEVPMIELRSMMTCPACGQSSIEVMPTDACQYVYDCRRCRAQLKPKQGDCCVLFLRLRTVPADLEGDERGPARKVESSWKVGRTIRGRTELYLRSIAGVNFYYCHKDGFQGSFLWLLRSQAHKGDTRMKAVLILLLFS